MTYECDLAEHENGVSEFRRFDRDKHLRLWGVDLDE